MTIYITIPRDELPARRAYDHYATEPSLIRLALALYGPARVASVLDPGAGDGRWGRLTRARYPDAHIAGVELRHVCPADTAGFDAWYQADFLAFEPGRTYDLVAGNPPYGPRVDRVPLAEHFVRRAWALLAPLGRIVFLLRANFQASEDRYHGLWLELPPTVVALCSQRPSFGNNRHGRRGTNGHEYALFVWDKLADGSPAGTPRRWAVELLAGWEKEGN